MIHIHKFALMSNTNVHFPKITKSITRAIMSMLTDFTVVLHVYNTFTVSKILSHTHSNITKNNLFTM